MEAQVRAQLTQLGPGHGWESTFDHGQGVANRHSSVALVVASGAFASKQGSPTGRDCTHMTAVLNDRQITGASSIELPLARKACDGTTGFLM